LNINKLIILLFNKDDDGWLDNSFKTSLLILRPVEITFKTQFSKPDSQDSSYSCKNDKIYHFNEKKMVLVCY